VSSSIVPTADITASSTNICAGSTVNFSSTITGGGSAPAYQWLVNGQNVGTGLSTFSSSTLNDGDSVVLQLTSSEACANPAMVYSDTIIINVTDIPATPNIMLITGDSLESSVSGTAYSWYLDNAPTSFNSKAILPDQNGYYRVQVWNQQCVSDTSFPYNYTLIGMQENLLMRKGLFSIIPNPNRATFIVRTDLSQQEQAEITIYEASGKPVYQGRFIAPEMQFTDMELSPGVYMVLLKTDKAFEVRKMVIVR
jgi:hypothetical protein